jgi:cis-zeatin O-glucosyltransferase
VAEDPQYSGKKLFAIGPLNPLLDATTHGQNQMHSRGTSAWIGWTSNHRCRFCTSTLTAGQVTELATALCDSKQQFLWVLSDVDRAG